MSAAFITGDPTRARQVRVLLGRLPRLAGAEVRIESQSGLRDRRGAVHAASFLRQRRMVFDCRRSEFPRIFVHELFHFVWLRAGNPARREFESLLAGEWRAGAAGELGWSAEWRKQRLDGRDVTGRSRRWREYCCESFCDTAAWLYGGVKRHREFTLAGTYRLARRRWFRQVVERACLSI